MGPVAQNLSFPNNELLNSPNGVQDTTRVIIMDTWGLITNNEDHIQVVDGSGHLLSSAPGSQFNPPPVLKWWIEESKLLDVESTYDITTVVYYHVRRAIRAHAEQAQKEGKRLKEAWEKANNKPPQPEKAKPQTPDQTASPIVPMPTAVAGALGTATAMRHTPLNDRNHIRRVFVENSTQCSPDNDVIFVEPVRGAGDEDIDGLPLSETEDIENMCPRFLPCE